MRNHTFEIMEANKPNMESKSPFHEARPYLEWTKGESQGVNKICKRITWKLRLSSRNS